MRQKIVNLAGVQPRQGSEYKRQSRHTNSAMLATGGCYCGGPGGRPGLYPVCINCLRGHRYMGQVFTRLAAGVRHVYLHIWCARGSQGFQADWIKPSERNAANSDLNHPWAGAR